MSFVTESQIHEMIRPLLVCQASNSYNLLSIGISMVPSMKGNFYFYYYLHSEFSTPLVVVCTFKIVHSRERGGTISVFKIVGSSCIN